MRLMIFSLACVALAVLGGGCRGSGSSTHVSVAIRISRPAAGRKPIVTSYELTCRPVGGTLPLARRVCSDIARHPVAMLRPRLPLSGCGGMISGPTVRIRATEGGRHSSFGGQPFCDWPGGTAVGIYFAAATRDLHTLANAEPRLRCDDDPALLARPTPWSSVAACTHGLWTPRAEQLIRAAKRATALAPLAPERLFPADIGARRCEIPRGGPVAGRLHGLCGVSVRHTWSRPVVVFVESWPRGGKGRSRHSWLVSVRGGRPAAVAEAGATAPQLWK